MEDRHGSQKNGRMLTDIVMEQGDMEAPSGTPCLSCIANKVEHEDMGAPSGTPFLSSIANIVEQGDMGAPSGTPFLSSIANQVEQGDMEAPSGTPFLPSIANQVEQGDMEAPSGTSFLPSIANQVEQGDMEAPSGTPFLHPHPPLLIMKLQLKMNLLYTNSGSYSPGNFSKDVYLLPNDTEMDKIGEDNLTLIYWKYINSLQVLCRNQMRLGVMEDGGKETCLDEKYKPRYPCLVYSFGSNFQFDFELSVMKHFNCEIHTFDPTLAIQARKIPDGIKYHLIGLSDKNITNTRGWKMQTLSTIRKTLNHTGRVLDILKIDIEGGEWSALPEIFESGVLNYVKQLCIEIHFGRTITLSKYSQYWGDVSSKDQLKILRDLHELGFRTFMHEHNLFAKMKFRQPYGIITTVNEISLINTRW